MQRSAKKLRLLFSFYSGFAFSAIIISIACAVILSVNGYQILAALTWFKIISMAIIVYYINTYKHKEFYYYHNLGLSKRLLWTFTLSLDFLLCIIMFIIIIKFNLSFKLD